MAGIVEQVYAQVRYEFPLDERTNSASERFHPSATLTIKQFEDFLFNARMRGAEDDTKCKIETKRYWDGISHEAKPCALSVGVNASMDGMPLMVTEKTPAKEGVINWPTLAAQVVFSILFLVVVALL